MDEFHRRQRVIARDMLRSVRRTERVLAEAEDQIDPAGGPLSTIDTDRASRSFRRKRKAPARD
jgi:hypothetical protein